MISLTPQATERSTSESFSEYELFLIVTAGALIFAATIVVFNGWHFLTFGDNEAYLQAATAVRSWDFRALDDVQHFLGYPYAIALISVVLHVPILVSLFFVSGVSSLIGTLMVARLFGTRVAAYFAILNFAWWQASLLGGSEPTAVALGMGAFWTFRRGYPAWAALLGAMATTVRPLFVFTLVGFGVALLLQKAFKHFLAASSVGVAIGLLYVWPLWHYLGDPLRTVNSYTSRDYGAAMIAGPHGHLFSWPFYAIVVGTITYPAPWTNLILSFFWIGLVIAGVAAMSLSSFRGYSKIHPAEVIFCGFYLLAIFCYGYLVWARGNFIRFSIPALPFIFFALERWLPKDRKVIFGLGLLCPALAACSAIGINRVFLFH